MIKLIKGLSKIILIIILLLFTASYIISSSGYYEYNIREKNVITNDRIKEFEEDIKNNKEIDLKDYIENDKEDYSNNITNIVYNISNSSNKLAKKTIKYLFKKLGSFIDE